MHPASRQAILTVSVAVSVGVAESVQAAEIPPPPPLERTADARSTFPHGVAAGDVTRTSAVLWAKLAVPGQVLFQYFTDSGMQALLGAVPVDVIDTTIPAKTEISGLAPGTTYYYRTMAPDGARLGGKFRTPPAPGERRGVRFGASGDWIQGQEPYVAIRNVPERDLDFFVALGDTIYADHPSPGLRTKARTPGEFRSKYVESLSVAHGLSPLADARASTAFFATIDDHEVLNDFAGGAPLGADPRFEGERGAYVNDTGYYRAGLQAFHDYWPLRTESWDAALEPRFGGKPRLYRQRTYGSDAAMFVLDARSFRDAPLERVMSRNLWDVGSFLFRAGAFGRTMLGRAQLDQLESDLLAAQRAGVVWKFVFVPEPIQNLGVIAANDRFEGYAAERSELLGFIHERGVQNVVFVSADFHGTLVNELNYSWYPLTPANRTGAWEIITGPVAVDISLGAGIAQFAAQAGIITPAEKQAYDALDRAGKDRFIGDLVDRQVRLQFLDPLGLQDAGLGAVLDVGDYAACHTFGWTEFAVEGLELLVTTYGIEAYTAGDLAKAPRDVLARQPEIVQRFRVKAARGGI